MKIRLKNYKCFEDVEIPLSHFNVVVGPNSSGKSAFLESIKQLSRFSQIPVDSPDCWQGEDIKRIGCYWAKGGQPVEFECEFEVPQQSGKPVKYRYQVELKEHLWSENKPSGNFAMFNENLWMNDELLLSRKGQDEVSYHPSGTGEKRVSVNTFESFLLQGHKNSRNSNPRSELSVGEARLYETAGEYWRDVRYFNFVPELICGWQEPKGLALSELHVNGENLMQTLELLRDLDTEAFEGINRELKKLNSECQGLTFDRTEKIEYEDKSDSAVRDRSIVAGDYMPIVPPALSEKRRTIVKRLAFRFEKNGKKITLPASMVSSGLVLFTAFATLLHTTGKPSILMVEEPERGVHPAILADIVKWLREIANPSDGSVGPIVIITTHSPYLLDYCEPEEVLVFNRKDGGSTQVKRMADIKDIKNLLNEFQPGELWTALSEDGIFKSEDSSDASAASDEEDQDC
jgi:predicted ATPase